MSRTAVLEQLARRVPLIGPSMLKCDFGNLHREIELLESAGVPLLHLDIMDGHFVPNLSYGPMVIRRLREMTDLPFDAHLMISEPERYLDEYLDAGCDCITFHIEAVPDAGPLLRRIRDADAVAGLALNPKTPVQQIEPLIADCDLMLVMSVEPGFGGQKFIPASIEKISRLKQSLGQNQFLSIDGGIGPATIADAAEAGANLFVAGSSIFDTADYGHAIRQLTELAASRMVSSSLPS